MDQWGSKKKEEKREPGKSLSWHRSYRRPPSPHCVDDDAILVLLAAALLLILYVRVGRGIAGAASFIFP